MKGIIIFESPSNNGTVNAEALEYCNVVSELVPTCCEVVTLTGNFDSHTTATTCNKDDTYDFETGALIALMKMCGFEKSTKAYAEIFDGKGYAVDALIEIDKLKEEIKRLKDDNYKNALQETTDCLNDLSKRYDEVVKYCDTLRESNKSLQEENSYLNYVKSCNESTIESLEKTRDLLKAENKELKSDKDKSWKNYQRNIQKKQDRINELEKAVSDAADTLTELNDKYDKAMDGLRKAKELDELREKHSEELLDRVNYWKSQVNRLCSEKHSLEEKVEKLKLDCEKLRHGYLDTDMCYIFGGRQNGKQYTLLVDLFKKIDQKKVDAAYKEAYNTTLPVWQKEALRQAYEIRKESKEKTELPRTLDIKGTKYRKMLQIKDYGEQISKLTVDSLIEESRKFTAKCVDEWLYKPPTKREKMWERILEIHKKSNVVIVVEKEDVSTFLHEIENRIPEIRWASRQKIFEAKGTIKDIYGALKTCDRVYFRLRKENELSYSSDPHTYLYTDLEHISYIPPMRWDLFKKGRLAVKVNYENYQSFYDACSKELGMRPYSIFCGDFTVSICKDVKEDSEDADLEAKIVFEVFSIEDQKKTGRKIVDWEDVR